MSNSIEALISRDLLSFQLFDWLKIGDEEERETLLAIVDTAQKLASDSFMTHYRQSDIDEPTLDHDGVHILPAIHDALQKYAEMGLFGTSFSEELGGLGLKFAASLAIYANFTAANVSTAGYTMLTVANARLISTFGTERQIEQFATPEIEGRWLGTMCLSEPQAGSSLGDSRTRAVPDGEDEFGFRYRLSGNKMWISGGDQDATENIVHLVLAKVEKQDGSMPEGSKGISLFIVPKILPDGTRNDIAVAGLNHKMGNRGTSNCLLNFGENDGAVGWRVGAEGQGLPQMFMMMNEARISVGIGAASLAYRGYRQSLRYAQERYQGRNIGTKGGEPIAIMQHPDVRKMLLQQKAYAEGAIAICLYCAKLVDLQDEESETLLALLTPIAKSWPSEFGLIANDLAIQVHGGYGYTRDFDVEQLWRDNRLNPIHEGTTGIQAIDLLARKLLLSDGRSMQILRTRIERTVQQSNGLDELSPFGASLLSFWDDLAQVLATLDGSDVSSFDNATLFLRAFGHGVVAWLWLDQAIAADGVADTDFTEGVNYSCRFFFENELPQALSWLSIVGAKPGTVRAMPDSALA